MALRYTPEAETNSSLPRITATTVDGRPWSSETIENAPAKVIAFICNHCPYVQAIENRLIVLSRELADLNVPFVGICSNDASEHPEDAPGELLKRWREREYGFDYLLDESQDLAHTFGAVCTPDFFVYDQDNQLAYRGRLDDSWRNEAYVTRRELKDAVDKILRKEKITVSSPSMGCSIKWLEK